MIVMFDVYSGRFVHLIQSLCLKATPTALKESPLLLDSLILQKRERERVCVCVCVGSIHTVSSGVCSLGGLKRFPLVVLASFQRRQKVGLKSGFSTCAQTKSHT